MSDTVEAQGSRLVILTATSRQELVERLSETVLTPREGDEWPADRGEAHHGAHRLALVVTDPTDLAAKLARAKRELEGSERVRFNLANRVFYGQRDAHAHLWKTAFVFSGAGLHDPRVLAELRRFPAVAQWLLEVERTHGVDVGAEVLGRRRGSLDLADVAGGVLMVNLAIYTLVERLGVACHAMVGHSLGETAVLVASRMTGDFAQLAHLLRSIGEATDSGTRERDRGAGATYLAVRGSSLAAVEALCRDASLGLAVALDNCPQQAVLVGPAADAARLEELLKERGELCLKVPHLDRPVHGPLFPLSFSDLRRRYAALALQPPATLAYSATTAAPLPPDAQEARDVLARHWVQPQRFRETVERLYEDGVRTFVEIGAGGRAAGFVRDTLRGRDILAVPSLLAPGNATTDVRVLVARLFAAGVDVDLEGALEELQAVPGRSREPAGVGASWATGSGVASGRGRLEDGEEKREIEALVLEEVARVVGLTTPDLVDCERGFFDLGMGSLGSVELGERLGRRLGRRLPPTVALDHPTVTRLAEYLMGSAPEGGRRRRTSRRARRSVAESRPPIAVLGFGCRFAGGVHSPESFWELLVRGGDAVSGVPPGRWDPEAYDDPEGRARHGGFLPEIDRFDAAFFGISPREASTLDPQQRLLLECSWEALEHAAVPPGSLAGTRTGVFVGISQSDYATRLDLDERLAIGGYLATGNGHSTAAGRLAFFLGLAGPCLAVDTACSSSLVAVHLACQSLRRGESQLALAGGVHIMLSPETGLFLARARALSSQGRCRTFDAAADGYVRAEGCGVLALKRLRDAVADGDPVLAVIRGSAVGHDGRTSGFTVPSGPAQEAVIREALEDAGVEAADVSYVEAHGTGTSLGDPVEVAALGRVFAPDRPRDAPLVLGSVKTNLGHAEAAAGVAGLLRVILQLQHGALTPHLHLRTPNPRIDWQSLPFTVATEGGPWTPRTRLAGVSSFGLSGTNCHVVVAEAPRGNEPSKEAGARAHLVPLSASSPRALDAVGGRLHAHLSSRTSPEPPRLEDVARTCQVGRRHFSRRRALVAETTDDLVRKLDQSPAAGPPDRRRRLAFLFSGQGSQYPGMGGELARVEPRFRQALQEAGELFETHLGIPGSQVLSGVTGKEARGDTSPLDETGRTQPALFALEYALATLWRSWGIRPDAVLGHSVGQYVAAAVADVFSLEEAVFLVATRARLMQSLPRGGAMLAVEAPREVVQGHVDEAPERLAVAAVNGPRHVVLSGERDAIETIHRGLAARQVESRWLRTSHAFHSPLMDPILDEFAAAATQVSFQRPRIPVAAAVSDVAARPLGEEIATPEYWVRHLRETVRFDAGVEGLAQEGCDVFVEIGPAPVALTLAQGCLPGGDHEWLASLHRGRGEERQMLHGLGRLYELGFDVDWTAFAQPRPGRRVALPSYPFERRRHWVDPPPRVPRSGRGSEQTLLGERLDLPEPEDGLRFVSELSAPPAFLHGYRVLGRIPLPGSAYLAMALQAAAELDGSPPWELTGLELNRPLFLDGEEPTTLHTLVRPEARGGAEARIFAPEESGSGSRWRLLATATLSCGEPRQDPSSERVQSREGLLEEPREVLSGEDFYDACRHLGYEYGPELSVLRRLSFCEEGGGEDDARVELELPAAAAGASPHPAHPALLDGVLQALVALFHRLRGPGLYDFQGLERCRVHAPWPACVEVILRVDEDRGQEIRATAEIWTVSSEEGPEGHGPSLVATFQGMRFAARPVSAPVATLQRDDEDRRGWIEEFPALGQDERAERVAGYLGSLARGILGQGPDEAVDFHQPLTALGLDSLMAVRFRNLLQMDVRVSVSVARFMEGPTLAELASDVVALLSGESGRLEATVGDELPPLGGDPGAWVEGEL